MTKVARRGRRSWPVPRLWPKGTTVVIIGGGPSLTLKQIRRVGIARAKNKCRVIAVNDAVFVAWFADWLHVSDVKWWNWYRESAVKFHGIKTTATETTTKGWARFVRVIPPDENGDRGGMPSYAGHIAGGGNSVYQAMQLAARAGASHELLIGVDMKPVTGADGKVTKTHWFGEHPDRHQSDYEGTMTYNFPTLIEPFKAMGVKVTNCSPGSALTCFEAGDIDDLLGD